MSNNNKNTLTVALVGLLLFFVQKSDISVIPTPPGPAPQTAPIPVEGLHVLILEDMGGRTPEIARVINSGVWQSKVPEGNFRVYPVDVIDQIPEGKWRDAAKRPHGRLPWWIVSNHPKGGEEGPLPKTIQELSEAIDKWR